MHEDNQVVARAPLPQINEGAALASPTPSRVHIIDGSSALTQRLAAVSSQSLMCCGYKTAEEFLKIYTPSHPECLICDIHLSHVNELDLLRHLINHAARIPVIVITTLGDVTAAVQSIKLGAFDFIEKPFDIELLVNKINDALVIDSQRFIMETTIQEARERLATLSQRERSMLSFLIAGRSSKQIALELHISVKTVSNHRSHLLEKMRANNTPDLIRMALLAIPPR